MLEAGNLSPVVVAVAIISATFLLLRVVSSFFKSSKDKVDGGKAKKAAAANASRSFAHDAVLDTGSTLSVLCNWVVIGRMCLCARLGSPLAVEQGGRQGRISVARRHHERVAALLLGRRPDKAHPAVGPRQDL